MPDLRRRTCLLAAGLLLGAGASAPVVVSSKMDTEGGILAALIIDVLRGAGIPVTDRSELGPTSLVRAALLAGQIDLYPEYTGNGAIFFRREGDPAFRSAAAGLALDRALDRSNGIAWLDPAPADNAWAIAVASDFARSAHLATLEDFARAVGSGARTILAASSEFVESPSALPLFARAYGFHLRQDQLLVLAGGDTVATERAAAQGISGINATMAYTTDGPLALLPLVALSDPRHVQTAYAPVPVIRAEVLARTPRIRALLAPVFATLTVPVLRRLNARVAAFGEPVSAVARDYLASLHGRA